MRIGNDLFHIGYVMAAFRDKDLCKYFMDRGITIEVIGKLQECMELLHHATYVEPDHTGKGQKYEGRREQ